MARYKVLRKSFIDNHVHGPEEAPEYQEVEYDGIPGDNLEYISGEKPKMAPKAKTAEQLKIEELEKNLAEAKAQLAEKAAAPAANAESEDLG